MAIFGANSTPPQPESLRLPAARRISSPASHRLTTITEASQTNQSTAANSGAQPRGILRGPVAFNLTPGRRSFGAASQSTTRTGPPGPPSYEWVPEPIDGEDYSNAPVEGEKLAELRRRASQTPAERKRGGWGRLGLIAALVLLVIVGLAVGLGVGLTRKHTSDNAASDTSSQTPSTGQSQRLPFPLGEYSMITALRTADTNCTSNAATWRCYPYVVYNPSDSSTNTSSLASFNWVISNTSATYAGLNTSIATPDTGIPSNLTIRSDVNPFSITFANQPMAYISASGNSSSARYTFTFAMQKAVIPSTALTSNNAATECFFNQTTFTGTLYLDAPNTFPNSALASATGVGGGFTPWPYAVDVTQSSPGGQDVPACYLTVNGAVGSRILNGPSPESTDTECLCEYRNY